MSTTLSTHILDTANGVPAKEVSIVLSNLDTNSEVFSATTNEDGRYAHDTALEHGTYRIRFDTRGYFPQSLYPWADVVFTVAEDTPDHLHIPLLLSPFGYTTYRGS